MFRFGTMFVVRRSSYLSRTLVKLKSNFEKLDEDHVVGQQSRIVRSPQQRHQLLKMSSGSRKLCNESVLQKEDCQNLSIFVHAGRMGQQADSAAPIGISPV